MDKRRDKGLKFILKLYVVCSGNWLVSQVLFSLLLCVLLIVCVVDRVVVCPTDIVLLLTGSWCVLLIVCAVDRVLVCLTDSVCC